MKLLLGTLLLMSTAPLWAQSKPNKLAPELSDKAVAQIRTLQLRQAQLTIQAQQFLAQYQAQREQLDAEIKAAEEKALKDALEKAGGRAVADPAKYKVDDATLAIVPAAGPSGAGPAQMPAGRPGPAPDGTGPGERKK